MPMLEEPVKGSGVLDRLSTRELSLPTMYLATNQKLKWAARKTKIHMHIKYMRWRSLQQVAFSM